MYDRMIVADDGSALARSVVPRAAALAAADGSEVLVVRVSRAEGVRPQDLTLDEWRRYVSPQGRAAAIAAPLEAEPSLSDLVAALQERGVEQVGSLVLHGQPAESLTEATSALGASLLVMTSRGEGGIRRAVMGSVAEHLVREARTASIMLSPATAEATPEGAPVIGRIMLTLDGSDASESAIPHAEHLARVLGAELTLLRVDHEDDGLKIAEAELQAHADAMRARGVDALTKTVRSDDAAAAILATAEDEGVDLIVMASHGRGGLGRLLLGSVAYSVMRQSEHAAVLLVRPAADD